MKNFIIILKEHKLIIIGINLALKIWYSGLIKEASQEKSWKDVRGHARISFQIKPQPQLGTLLDSSI